MGRLPTRVRGCKFGATLSAVLGRGRFDGRRERRNADPERRSDGNGRMSFGRAERSMRRGQGRTLGPWMERSGARGYAARPGEIQIRQFPFDRRSDPRSVVRSLREPLHALEHDMNRREFVRGTAAAAALTMVPEAVAQAATTPPPAPSVSQPKAFKLRYAFNAGHFTNHAPGGVIDELKFAHDQGFTAM